MLEKIRNQISNSLKTKTEDPYVGIPSSGTLPLKYPSRRSAVFTSEVSDYIEKRNNLETLIDERNYKMTIDIGNQEEIKAITSTIDINITQILKLMQANEILIKARENHINEAKDKYNKENPTTIYDDLNKLISNSELGVTISSLLDNTNHTCYKF